MKKWSAPNPIVANNNRFAKRDCTFYSLCDDGARASTWSGFSCVGCDAYRRVTLRDCMDLFEAGTYSPQERKRLGRALYDLVPKAKKRGE